MSSVTFRVRGALAESALADARVGTVFVRDAFDLRSRAVLEVGDAGFVVRHEGFKKMSWTWRETPDVRRTYDAEESHLACRYFNSLLLSPGYLGPTRIDQAQKSE